MADMPRSVLPTLRSGIWPPLVGLVSHGVVIAAAVVAGWLTRRSSGGGMEDLGAFVGTFLLGEVLAFLFCFAGAIGLMVHKHGVQAALLLAGWALGLLCLASATIF